jgi:sulfite exporter TauE/SafE/copper chaperone CopZ
MAEHRTKGKLTVVGMTCSHCEKRIEDAVGALDGVLQVRASAPLCEVSVVSYPERVSFEAIANAIRAAGYSLRGDAGIAAPTEAPSAVLRENAPARDASTSGASVYRFLGLIAVIAALYTVLRFTGGFTFLPTVDRSMGYGLLFIVGLLTSLHCIAMCGGIVLSQGISRGGQPNATAPGNRFLPSLLYNGGRIISYTVIGGLVGALGSLFSLSTALKGVMPIIAGAFMLFLGVRILGIFPWLSRLRVRLSGVREDRISTAAAGRGPFIVGLLNGLMPCGPLQTMQVYALGTGSWYAGALSMFIFSLGTVPLLLGFGAISSFLSAKLTGRMLKTSGVIVAALGLLMFTRGLSLFGVALPNAPQASTPGAAVATVANGYQTVATTVESDTYHPLTVQVGMPVRWTISAKAEDLNGCNSRITIPQLGIQKRLVPGDNVIEFTPDHAGTIPYTCWMGMISSSIRVVPTLAAPAAR